MCVIRGQNYIQQQPISIIELSYHGFPVFLSSCTEHLPLLLSAQLCCYIMGFLFWLLPSQNTFHYSCLGVYSALGNVYINEVGFTPNLERPSKLSNLSPVHVLVSSILEFPLTKMVLCSRAEGLSCGEGKIKLVKSYKVE